MNQSPTPKQNSKVLLDLEAFKLNWRPQVAFAVADATRVAQRPVRIGEPRVYPIVNGEISERVMELRIRLAGFGGLKPGNTFDDATQAAVKLFEKDVMGKSDPTGTVDLAFAQRMDLFAAEWPILFKQIACPCGKCGGFGDGKNKGQYYKTPKAEKYHNYEYPGIHRCVLWGARALMFYCSKEYANSIRFMRFDSGYRCRIDNVNKHRPTTNHMGKAVDMWFETYRANSWNRGDADVNFASCNKVRALAVQRMKASTHWVPAGEFGLERGGKSPGEASTWVHLDVREWPGDFLEDSFFAKTSQELEGLSLVEWMAIPSAEQLFGGDK